MIAKNAFRFLAAIMLTPDSSMRQQTARCGGFK